MSACCPSSYTIGQHSPFQYFWPPGSFFGICSPTTNPFWPPSHFHLLFHLPLFDFWAILGLSPCRFYPWFGPRLQEPIGAILKMSPIQMECGECANLATYDNQLWLVSLQSGLNHPKWATNVAAMQYIPLASHLNTPKALALMGTNPFGHFPLCG